MNCLDYLVLEGLGTELLIHLGFGALGHLEHLETGVKEVDYLVRLEMGALVYLVYLELETEALVRLEHLGVFDHLDRLGLEALELLEHLEMGALVNLNHLERG